MDAHYWFGARHVEWREEVESTNTRAAALAGDTTIPLPALVVADRQTAGRGRGANRWWSSDGALTFSVLIDASEAVLPSAQWPLVSLATAVAVGSALEAYLPRDAAQLKWPNDVYVHGRKICGILVEAPPIRPARLVIGVGVNVNNRLIDAPQEIHASATSLVDETGVEVDREALLTDIMRRLLAGIDAVAAKRFDLSTDWAPRCLLYGKTVWIDIGDRSISGRCQGLDESGALKVATGDGVERLFAGVVRRWE